MNAKLSRSGFLRLCLLTGCFYGSGCATSLAQADPSDHYDNLESLKKGILFASKWWNVNVRGKSFVVCLEVPPYWGQSTENIYAWRKERDGSFTLVWSYRSYGIGPIEIEIEEDKGIVSVRAIANTEFRDSVVAFADLGATARY